MVTCLGGDVARNGARSRSAAARSSTLGPTGGSAHEWSRHPSRTRFVTVVMLTPTCPSLADLAAPIHIDHPSKGTSYTTRRGVEGSRSGSMKYVPGSRGAKFGKSMTFWIVGEAVGSLGAVGDMVVVSIPSGARAHPASATRRANPSCGPWRMFIPPPIPSIQPTVLWSPLCGRSGGALSGVGQPIRCSRCLTRPALLDRRPGGGRGQVALSDVREFGQPRAVDVHDVERASRPPRLVEEGDSGAVRRPSRAPGRNRPRFCRSAPPPKGAVREAPHLRPVRIHEE